MGKSRFKRAHKTHAFNQRAGEAYPKSPADGLAPSSSSLDGIALTLFAELCEFVPDADKRSALLGVPRALEEAWLRGERLPVLRAHRRRLERAVHAAQRLGAPESPA